MKELKKEIMKDGNQTKLMKKIQGVISDHQLVPVNRHSKNRKLYNNLVKDAVKLNEAGQTFLGRITVRINIKDESVLNADPHNLIRNNEVKTERKNGETYL